ncbi:MAG: hypothetical protein JO199_10360 [Candidatus Eremiobacteraeota bacterium]|nr:hypothetical protein [Candidatus Eremiobacteraeota bacterium]
MIHTRYLAALAVAGACALAACGARNDTAAAIPNTQGNAPMFEIVKVAFPKNAVGEELPSEGVGSVKDPTWGTVGGFTQSGKAQVLAFPPGTKITIRNLSKSLPHTFNWVATVAKPPAHFPSNPSLSFSAHGGDVFGKDYASGEIMPGKTVTVELSKPGTYLIGCAFHYSEGMQDVIRVVAHATPGPTH